MSKLTDWFLKRRIIKFMLKRFTPYQKWTQDCDRALYEAFPKQPRSKINQMIEEVTKQGLFYIGPKIFRVGDDDPTEFYEPDMNKISAYLNAPLHKTFSILGEYWKVVVGAVIVLIVGAIWALF